MNPPNDHRRTIRHYDGDGDMHELTFSCYQRMSLLTNDEWRRMLAESIDRAAINHRFSLAAYVFMPEHVHLLVFPTDPETKVEHFLYALKRPYSYRIKQLLISSGSPLLKKLTVWERRKNKSTFRYWQKGPGYDRNLNTVKAVTSSVDYIHMNPVRRGLCERAIDWLWSSARWYASEGQVVDPQLPKLHKIPAHFLAE